MVQTLGDVSEVYLGNMLKGTNLQGGALADSAGRPN
jgi:hypothetical protein